MNEENPPQGTTEAPKPAVEEEADGGGSKYLTAEEIIQSDDLPTQEVPCPEWGGTVLVRGLDGDGRDDFDAHLQKLTPNSETVEVDGRRTKMNLHGARAKLVSMTCINEDGELIFTPQQVRQLGKKSAKALDRVYSVAQALSGISDEDVEEMLGNLNDDRSAENGSS